MESTFLANSTISNQAWQAEFLARPTPEVAHHFQPLSPSADMAFVPGFPSRFNISPPPAIYSPPVATDIKGKQKMVELDDGKWEEQFRAFEQNMKDDEANKAIDTELDAQESQQFFGDFESIWKGIRAEEAENLASREGDIVDRFTDDVFDSNDLFEGRPDLGDYLFEPDNPYMEHPDPFSEGMRLAESGGSLSEAALCFEAVCQREPKRVEGWTMLGSVQAQNEKELAAIRALEQAIRLDESSLPALMVTNFYLITNSFLEPGSVLYKRRI